MKYYLTFSDSPLIYVFKWVFVFYCFLGSSDSFAMSPNESILLNSVYNDLKNTIGDTEISWPTLKISNQSSTVAAYYRRSNTILIDTLAIGICLKFGGQAKDAVAFLLGHELTHFYQERQRDSSHFLISKIDLSNNRKILEEQADLFGVFIAHQAGYQSITIVDTLLSEIYKTYKISAIESTYYPTLLQRIELSKSSCKVAKRLIGIYNVANYLLALGKYEESYHLYLKISKLIGFKELYNNMGVSSLFGYLQIDKSNPYIYPLDMDTAIPFTRTILRRTKKQLLDDAISNLSKATRMDASYYESFLHLLVAYDLNHEFSSAAKIIKQLEHLPLSSRQISKFQLISGNIFARQNKNNQAEQFYNSVLKNSGNRKIKRMAKNNKRYLTTGKTKIQHESILPVIKLLDQIDDISFINLNSISSLDTIIIDSELTLYAAETPHSYYYFLSSIDIKFYLQLISSINPTTKKGIGINSPLNMVKKVYGNTHQYMNTTEGGYNVYFENGLIFQYDEKEKIKQWALFSF